MTAHLDELGLLQRVEELAASARTSEGGISRLAWSAEDMAARVYIANWLSSSGVVTRIDEACNLIAELPGTQSGLRPLVMGSHLDTVQEGGALDGAYGVLAAFEVLRAIAIVGQPMRHPVRAVAWANEEGVVAPAFTGSRVAAGQSIDVDAVGPDGRSLGERINEAGGDYQHLANADMGDIAGYLELHIEQGPVLHRAGCRIGVVTGIVGATRGSIVFEGNANHAGTTPMGFRSDALVAAAHAVLAIERLGNSEIVDVATVGAIEVRPGNANVIAGYSRVSFDVRSMDDVTRDQALRQLRDEIGAIAAATSTSATMVCDSSTTATLTDPTFQQVIADCAVKRGLSNMHLRSGAGHDAQCVADRGPIGMIFVPSIDGLSHHRDERTDPDDLVVGAAVLRDALYAIDERLAT